VKILMIAPQPFFQPRGTPFSVRMRIKALADLGHQVDLVTYPLGEDVDIPGLRIFRMWRWPGLRHIPIGPSAVKFPLDFLICWASLWRYLAGRYDAVHTHEEAGGIGALVRVLFGKKHVYDMHSSLPEQLENYRFTSSGLLIGFARAFERWVMRHSDAVIAICPHLVDQAQAADPRARVLLIENQPVAGETAAGEPEVAALRERLGIAGPVVLYTGTFEKNQGIDLLLDGVPRILASCPDARVVIVGGEPAQVGSAVAAAERLGVGRQVVFTGQRPPEEMPVYVGLADILVSPRSSGTNTPLKIYSYLWSGKAIVATDLETHRQVLDETTALLVPATAGAIADAVVALLRDPARRATLGEAGRRVAEERYSYRVYLDKVREAYA
jgi:glycosyltransferase involved in cell wall biosynthesis